MLFYLNCFHVSALALDGKFLDIPFKLTTIIKGSQIFYELRHISFVFCIHLSLQYKRKTIATTGATYYPIGIPIACVEILLIKI